MPRCFTGLLETQNTVTHGTSAVAPWWMYFKELCPSGWWRSIGSSSRRWTRRDQPRKRKNMGKPLDWSRQWTMKSVKFGTNQGGDQFGVVTVTFNWTTVEGFILRLPRVMQHVESCCIPKGAYQASWACLDLLGRLISLRSSLPSSIGLNMLKKS